MSSDTSGAVLVTGGTGFLGLACVEQLLGMGIRVVVVAADEMPSRTVRNFGAHPGELTAVRCDVRDGDAIRRVVEEAGVETIIHAAAMTPDAGRARSEAPEIVEVNIGGTHSVLDVARHESVRRLVYLSSGAVYGEAAFGPDPVDETTRADPTTLYGITKLAAERLTSRHGELYDTEVVAARISAAFGPWERDSGVRDLLSPIYQMVMAARRGDAVVLPRDASSRNWVYSRDVASAIARLALGPGPRHFLYNLTPSTPLSLQAWARRLQSAFPALLVRQARRGSGTLTHDADPLRRRAPVSNERIRAEMAGWPRYEPELALDDYLDWIEAHPDWV